MYLSDNRIGVWSRGSPAGMSCDGDHVEDDDDDDDDDDDEREMTR